MKKALGYLLLSLPFAVIFAVVARGFGFWTAVVFFGSVAVFVALVIAGTSLISE